MSEFNYPQTTRRSGILIYAQSFSQSVASLACHILMTTLTVELHTTYPVVFTHLSELCRRNAQYCVRDTSTNCTTAKYNRV